MPHRGLHNTSVFEQLHYAARRMIMETYRNMLLSTTPITRLNPPKHERNREIRHRHQQGESLSSLAQVFGITEQRIWQILHDRRK